MPPHYVIVTGGVLSGLGKGVATASLGALFGMMGLRCTLKKLDPYLNVDPGTMNPVEHGEVFVTHDGAETDLDLGYYERFAGIRATKANSTSSGQLFQRLLERERKGDFLGKTVQMVPHFTDELQAFIESDADAYDVVLCEIGGSVGDIEAMAFYEALCRLRAKVGSARFVLVHLVYVVHYLASNEFKTKPAQNAIRDLMRTGLTPDVLVCRFEHPTCAVLPADVKAKVRQHCAHIVDAPNVASIYDIPLRFVTQGLPAFFRQRFALAQASPVDTRRWEAVGLRIAAAAQSDAPPLRVALVGKYVQLHDAYCSLLEAVFHASLADGVRRAVKYVWVDARTLEAELHGLPEAETRARVRGALDRADAVLVPLQCEYYALEGLSHLVRTIDRVKRAFNPSLEIQGVVLTMYDRRNNLSDMVAADVREHFGDKVYRTVIPRNVRVSEAPSHGKPVLVYDWRCAGSQAYIHLAREMLRRERKAVA